MDVTTVYGIPNCDMTQKALIWFKEQKISVNFHDYKTAGITKEKLLDWSKKKNWEILLNKRSTTWRALSVAEQEKITNQAAAIDLMMKSNTIIKRPVIEHGDQLFVGFDEGEIKRAFK